MIDSFEVPSVNRNFTSKLIGLAVFAALLVGLTTIARADTIEVAASDWSIENHRLSTVGQLASLPSIAIAPNGNLHVAFKQGANPVYTSSSNQGATWSALTAITTNTATSVVDKVDIAVDNNVIHAAWTERDNNLPSYKLQYSSNSNGSWSAPVTVEEFGPGVILGQPSLAATSGRVYLVWERVNSGVRFSSRSGGVWSDPKDIPGTATAIRPEISLDSSENLSVAYVKISSTNTAHYVESSDLGTNWTDSISLSSNVYVQDVDIEKGGSATHVTFGAINNASATREEEPYHVSCTANCGDISSWQAASLVTNREFSALPVDAPISPAIAVTEMNEVLVFFHGVSGSNRSKERVMGSCFIPADQSNRDFSLPTVFTLRMVNPQIVYSNDVMHMVYEKVDGQTNSANLREVFYAQLDVNCFNLYLPLIQKN